MTRRFTLGQVWLVSHDYDEFRATVTLVVERSGRPTLVAPSRKRYPATPQGWTHLTDALSREFSGHRGGRWHGAG